MTLLNICFCIMTFFSGTNPDKGDITVIGKAHNVHLGACIISKDNKKMYFIEGLEGWDENTLGKYIKVTGKLKIEHLAEPKPEPGQTFYQRVSSPIMRIIQNPKWKLVK